ncbi:hypothetical protein G7B40_009785 [Aetokthonos hydrillicola Thurmond2011]|jgi:hypothetical protein|uniref:Uncharacterized protein n=1 Tax=Aetokthonos hydrillicola Thurmond2011 TaxID=2712845 RepID=A0AAP5I7U4_9CYAN|nr:hypothetical protein [Aetokthonos hydrillicola]MDR9894853.1 hypothetical protein [Aetokthonos hydrillicola Thurmond2011]
MSTELIAERSESVKAGIIAGSCIALAFVVTTLVNNLILLKNCLALSCLNVNTLNWHLLISWAVASFSGLLFGVTYRYIVREDKNPQLKLGAVLAFGLTRSLVQLEVAFSYGYPILPFLVLGVESILWFSLAAIVLDTCIQFGWVKPFKSI